MLPWKPLLAVVPAGLLLGLVAGQATRPVMLIEDDRAWPYPAEEAAREADRWPSFDLTGPGHATRGYSYRPDIDYDRYVWPDQTDRSAQLLADDDYGSFEAGYDEEDDNLPLTRRAVLELASRRADGLAAGTVEEAMAENPPLKAPPDAPQAAEDERSAFVLPPVPPPLARAGTLPELAETDEDEAF